MNILHFGASEERDSTVVERVFLIWILSLFASWGLALIGYFSIAAIATVFGLSFLGAIFFTFRITPSKTFLITGGALLLYAALLGFFSTPSIFSGRDQGSYASAAISLAQTQTLTSSSDSITAFFQLYGPGKALNFPGFFYTESGQLVTQFPLGSIAWYAGHVSLFGIAGLTIANIFTLSAALLGIFLLLRRTVPSIGFALSGTAIAALSFPVIWFSKFTLSENLALTLFLLSAISLSRFIERPNHLSLFATIGGLLFLSITRIEGVILLLVGAILILLKQSSRQFITTHIFTATILFIVSSTALLANVFVNQAFFRSIASALLRDAHSAESNASLSILHSSWRTIELAWTYGLAPIFFLASIGLIFFFVRKEARPIPLIATLTLALPTTLYLVSPHIAADHPWELRRLLFSIWPTSILLATFAVSKMRDILEQKNGYNILLSTRLVSWVFAALAILPSIPATLPVLFFSENTSLLQATEHFSQKFTDRDLILIDRMASGDPFAMVTDPLRLLFHKEAVYFFNPNDLTRLDTSHFDHIYLVAQNEEAQRYQDALLPDFSFEPIDTLSFSEARLRSETDATQIPSQEHAIANDIIFLVKRKGSEIPK